MHTHECRSVTQESARAQPSPGAFDWRRFWIRSLLAVFAFNVAAALITWYWIFPHLFPAS